MARIQVSAASLACFAFVAAIALPMLSGPAAALAQSTNFRLEGKITRVSPGQLTVSGEGNIVFRVRFDDKTEIKRQDGSKGSAKDLRVGVKVRIEGDLTEAGEIVAQKIELQEDAATEKHSRAAAEACPPAPPKCLDDQAGWADRSASFKIGTR